MSALPQDKPQAEGREGYRAFRTIPTRWMDNDAYGHVNNVVYYGWFDTAVNAHLIEQGVLDIHEGETIGLVIETQCNYFAPVEFPQVVEAGLAGGPHRPFQRALRGGPVPAGRREHGGQGPLRACVRGPADAPAGGAARAAEEGAGGAAVIPETSQVATVVADADSVDAAIASRFSCRAFQRERAVPRAMIEDILTVASRAPSGTNTQPWNVYVLQGAARDELSDKVCAAHDAVYRER